MTHCTACRAARPQSARLLSLFDSLGPIMSGPSSSHTAGMARIGRMGRSLGRRARRNASPCTFSGRSPIPIRGTPAIPPWSPGSSANGGLPQCPHALRLAAERGVEVEIRTHPDSDRNPNTVSMELTRGGRTYAVVGVSVGGGEIEMTELEGFPLCLRGNADGALFIGPDGLGRLCSRRGLGRCPAFPA